MSSHHYVRIWILTLLVSGRVAWGQRPLGIDVSKYQPTINWTQVLNSGRVFAFIKSTEGVGYTDPYVTTHMTNAKAAGMLIGAYHFARPDLGNTATAEANWFVSVAGSYMVGGYLPPVLDLEVSGSNLATWTNDFCNRVQTLKGVRPIIYTSYSIINAYLDNSNTASDLWYANPTNGDPQIGNPVVPRWSTWKFWQYSWTGSVPGISGDCDLDVFHGTMSELLAYVIPGGSNPPTIAQHPVSQIVAAGDTATFSVTATGATPLSYRWQKNQVDMSNGGHYSGVLTAMLTISTCDNNDVASYRCVVTNSKGTATSNGATLTLGSQPANYIVESRTGGLHYGNYSETGIWSDGSCKSTATGCTANIGSRWCTITSTAATAVFKFTPANTGTYEIFTTNCNTANSGEPLIHKITHAGGTASVGACQNMACANNAINKWYSLGQYTLNAGTLYSVTLDGSTGSGSSPISNAGRSDAIQWTWLGSIPAPTITQDPAPQDICPAGTATFTVAATGQGTLTYQWQRNSVSIGNGGHFSGVTTPTLSVSTPSSGEVGAYRCVVSNSGGSTNSNTAALTLKAVVVADIDQDCDVDNTDYTLFQACFSGPDIARSAGCAAEDLDHDNDVDQTDFGILQRCMSGLGVPPNLNCAS